MERAGSRSPTLTELISEIENYETDENADENAKALAELKSVDLAAEPSKGTEYAELFDFPAASEVSALSTNPEELRGVGRPKGTGKRQIIRAKAGEEYRALRYAPGAKRTLNPRDYQFDYFNFVNSFQP